MYHDISLVRVDGLAYSVPVGGGPLRTVVVGDAAYVASGGSNTVAVIELGSRAHSREAVGLLGPSSFGTTINPQQIAVVGSNAYVTSASSDDLYVVPVSAAPMTTIPIGASTEGIVAVGTTLHVAGDSGGSGVYAVDTMTDAVSLLSAASSPYGIAASPDGSTLYVSSHANNTVTVIPIADPGSATSFAITQPGAVAMTPDGSRAYVTSFLPAQITAIDAATLAIGQSVPLAGHGISISFTADGSRAVVPNVNTNQVSVLDIDASPTLSAADDILGEVVVLPPTGADPMPALALGGARSVDMATVTSDIDIEMPVSTVYNQWTQFEDFPAFMSGVKAIQQRADDELHWEVSVGGVEREFEARITEQQPDERIAWRSLNGPDQSGVVTFHRLDDDSTRVRLQLDWDPEGFVEKVGAMLQLDDAQVAMDLKRFKELIESNGFETGAWRGSIDRAPDASGR